MMADMPSQPATTYCWRVLLVASLLHCSPVSSSAQSTARLLDVTKVVRAMDEASLIQLVPAQSGLQYVGCPNCTAGRQERQLEWTIERPDIVTCRYCRHEYPSDTYPMRDAVVVHNPQGELARFEYWADDSGYRYFFKARRDDEVRQYLARQTLSLAQLYAATGDVTHARRAAVILDRFAQVFPGWCYHFDYPFRQTEIYDGDVPPEKFRSGYRTARWTWWAYLDIPSDLVEAFRLIRDSGAFEELSRERGVDVAGRIERDLLRNAGEQVLANPDDYTNMSPSAWRSLVKLGRVIEEPRYVHEVVRRFQRLMELQFFYDGCWCEGAPSYGSQTINSLSALLESLRGYSDPPGYLDPVDGTRFDMLDLDADDQLLQQARSALRKLHLPNGRPVPVHDTWSTSERADSQEAPGSYLLPALGHACLGTGAGTERCEWHLSWSGGYGHQHADVLSLLLFGNGRELLSDLGYTHTAYRAWTLATAAHNTVVIDGLSQDPGSRSSPTDGRLRFIDLKHPHVQVVSADGTRAYAGPATVYQRTIVVINAGGAHPYAVDIFDVTGGRTHDYFFHGDADGPAAVTANIELSDLATLLPDGFDWQPPINEGEAGRAFRPHDAYGFLRHLKSAGVTGDAPVEIDFVSRSTPPAGLCVTLLPQGAGQLVLGQNPSIRQAGEDDARLEEFSRPFMMLRHHSDNGRSRFVAVLEPYQSVPSLAAVQPLAATGGAVVLKLQHEAQTDFVVIGSPVEQPVPVDDVGGRQAHFRGDVGVLSLRNGEIERAYALGEGGWRLDSFELEAPGAQTAALAAAERDGIVVTGNNLAPPSAGDVVRLLTADGWVYPYHVSSVMQEPAGGRLHLTFAEGPGFDYDATGARLRLRSFPQRAHLGPVKVEWQAAAVWSSGSSPARSSNSE